MSHLSHRGLTAFVAGALAVSALGAAVPAFAASPAKDFGQQRAMANVTKSAHPAVVGTISAINGTTLTVTSQVRAKEGRIASSTALTTATYSVDAANATVTKNNATSTLAALAVGDTVMIEGTVSGTTVTATIIRDGIARMGQEMNAQGPGEKKAVPVFQGNGQPIVGGVITAMSGSTLTLSTPTKTVYTIDAANATVLKGNATSTVSALATGDSVIVQGAVNGTSVTASSVLLRGAGPNIEPQAPASTTPAKGGILKSVGTFFSRLFGFF